jgi:glycosyltransferase involved in cell wall biosynthesis
MRTSSRTHVLLVVRHPVGGIRTFLRYVYSCFDPSKYRFSILGPEDPEFDLLRADLEGEDVRWLQIAGPVSSKRFAAAVFKEILFGGPYDLVHSHGLTAGLCAALPARLRRRRHVVTLHDTFHQRMFQGMNGRARRALINAAMPMFDIITPVSDDAAENLLQHMASCRSTRVKKRIIVVRNGIDTSRFISAEARNLRREVGLGLNTFLIGFMGRFMSQKGFRYLLEAVEIIRDQYRPSLQPVILTFGQGGFIREEQALVRRKGLEGCCYFMPFVADIASTIRGLDVIAMPSLWEACSLLPMEAMVAGTPIIGTNVIGLRETLRDSPAVMVSARDSASLARAIAQEMVHPSKEASEAFRAEAAERFDVTRQAKGIESLYSELLRRTRSRDDEPGHPTSIL